MAFNTSSWCVREDVNKAKLKLEIPNFSDVVANTTKGQEISSKQFDVGRSKFTLDISPNGDLGAEEGMFSAFLSNRSNHDVVVDYTISVEEGKVLSVKNEKIVKGNGRGWGDFMKASEVKNCLEIVVEVKLRWENISGGVVKQNQANGKELVQVEERLKEKLEQVEGKLEQVEGKLEQVEGKLVQMEKRMKTFVQGEIAKVKATPIPECPVCFQDLTPPMKIVQCLKVGVYGWISFPKYTITDGGALQRTQKLSCGANKPL